jgi:hypothetical protein
MPEPPDFERIAHDIVTATFAARFRGGLIDASDLMRVTEHLRLLWNARGVADLATIEAEFPCVYTKTLDRALRPLDR